MQRIFPVAQVYHLPDLERAGIDRVSPASGLFKKAIRFGSLYLEKWKIPGKKISGKGIVLLPGIHDGDVPLTDSFGKNAKQADPGRVGCHKIGGMRGSLGKPDAVISRERFRVQNGPGQDFLRDLLFVCSAGRSRRGKVPADMAEWRQAFCLQENPPVFWILAC
jgi:hypothetical protein